MKTQVTLWLPEDIEQKVKKTSLSLETNRQGAILHILEMYYQKEYSPDSAKLLQ